MTWTFLLLGLWHHNPKEKQKNKENNKCYSFFNEIFCGFVNFSYFFVCLRLTEILINNFSNQASDIFLTASESFIMHCCFTGVTVSSSLEDSQDSEGEGGFNLEFLALLYR